MESPKSFTLQVSNIANSTGSRSACKTTVARCGIAGKHGVEGVVGIKGDIILVAEICDGFACQILDRAGDFHHSEDGETVGLEAEQGGDGLGAVLGGIDAAAEGHIFDDHRAVVGIVDNPGFTVAKHIAIIADGDARGVGNGNIVAVSIVEADVQQGYDTVRLRKDLADLLQLGLLVGEEGDAPPDP